MVNLLVHVSEICVIILASWIKNSDDIIKIRFLYIIEFCFPIFCMLTLGQFPCGSKQSVAPPTSYCITCTLGRKSVTQIEAIESALSVPIPETNMVSREGETLIGYSRTTCSTPRIR